MCEQDGAQGGGRFDWSSGCAFLVRLDLRFGFEPEGGRTGNEETRDGQWGVAVQCRHVVLHFRLIDPDDSC